MITVPRVRICELYSSVTVLVKTEIDEVNVRLYSIQRRNSVNSRCE
jgi:hypothetical protein